MAQNPLLGNRISLISKKNIRYEGTLYSINENDATVALQNVKSFGTEGREENDPSCTFVPPQDTLHPYLLFRGCDIKDLHVHESTPAAAATDTAAPAASEQPAKKQESSSSKPKDSPKSSTPPDNTKHQDAAAKKNTRRPRQSHNNKPKSAQVGTGASLLNRKARGTVAAVETPQDDFDFQSNLANFQKEDDGSSENEEGGGGYAKDDFFDSISCDATDKRDGVDHRLRGSQERSLNTETFGAVALNSHRRRRYGGGRGGRGGRGRGRGRGRGGGQRNRDNNRWRKDHQSGSQRQSSSQPARASS